MIGISTEERRDRIIDLIKKEKEVKVSDLKKKFSCSNVTLRNDLVYLEKKGLIERVYGSAILKNNTMIGLFDESNVKNIREKQKISEYAAGLIGENESIMLYTGSTALQIAKNLGGFKNLNVVTNSIITSYELGKNPYIKVILLGGYYNPDTHAIFGQHAITQLQEYKLDKLFLSVDGISSQYGATSEHPYETDICKAMVEKANQVIVTADYSKIGISRFTKIASLEEIDMLITDDKAPGDELKRIEEKGIKVIVV